MLIIWLLLQFFFTLFQARRKYGRGRGASMRGTGQMTQTFGKGVASLIKDIKQGNFGNQQQYPQYQQGKANRFFDRKSYFDSIGSQSWFIAAYVIIAVIIVAAIIYFIAKSPSTQQKNQAQEIKRKNQQRLKNYEALKCINQNGIHPDKAAGRLQKIKFK